MLTFIEWIAMRWLISTHASDIHVLRGHRDEYFFDTDRHHLPHVHVKYGEFTAVIAIGSLATLQGDLPANKLRLVIAWMELHRDELMANWELASNGEPLFKSSPLQ